MAKRIILSISGMECPNCAMTLEGIEDLEGVITAEASYRKAQMVVAYNETMLHQEDIIAEVKRLGYQVDAVTAAG